MVVSLSVSHDVQYVQRCPLPMAPLETLGQRSSGVHTERRHLLCPHLVFRLFLFDALLFVLRCDLNTIQIIRVCTAHFSAHLLLYPASRPQFARFYTVVPHHHFSPRLACSFFSPPESTGEIVKH